MVRDWFLHLQHHDCSLCGGLCVSLQGSPRRSVLVRRVETQWISINPVTGGKGETWKRTGEQKFRSHTVMDDVQTSYLSLNHGTLASHLPSARQGLRTHVQGTARLSGNHPALETTRRLESSEASGLEGEPRHLQLPHFRAAHSWDTLHPHSKTIETRAGVPPLGLRVITARCQEVDMRTLPLLFPPGPLLACSSHKDCVLYLCANAYWATLPASSVCMLSAAFTHSQNPL